MCRDGPWIDDMGEYWTYDCDVLTGDHFRIYSDGSSLENKQIILDIAEEKFAELYLEFMVGNLEALGMGGDFRLYLFAFYAQPFDAKAGRQGFVYPAPDCLDLPYQDWDYYLFPEYYKSRIKHEICHIFQLRLTGCQEMPCYMDLPVWVQEGQARYMQGELPVIDTAEEYSNWMEGMAKGVYAHPLSIIEWINFPDQYTSIEYYPMFALAYLYLVHEQGLGRSMADIRTFFDLLKGGVRFDNAFPQIFGLTAAEYRDRFNILMLEFLTKLENTRGIR